MKAILFSFILSVIFFSCSNNDDNDPEIAMNTSIIGNWKLIEVLNDPGDGSGSFTPVESDKIIRFHKDGIMTSNGSICSNSITNDNPSSGTYSSIDATFKSGDCNNLGFSYSFEDNALTVNYPCFEACSAKYVKINDTAIEDFKYEGLFINKESYCGENFIISLKNIGYNNDFEDGTYNVDFLPNDLKIEGSKFYLNCRIPNNSELYPCPTLGPSYPQLIITDSKKIQN